MTLGDDPLLCSDFIQPLPLAVFFCAVDKKNLIGNNVLSSEGRYALKNSILIGILAIVAGVLVLAWNDALQWIVGVFLIVWGAITLLGKT
jgi:uncharacterized membrane protein HdeD (DUF308 family)